MKRIYILSILLLVSIIGFAQVPEKMSYQAVLRDAFNNLLLNKKVGIQISLLQGSSTGTAVYIESQTASTNINGLVSLEIGSGESTTGSFATIDWSAGPYFMKTEVDIEGGTEYKITGTSQLMFVPFAMYAKTSGSSEINATNINNNTTAIALNTLKESYTEALVSANTNVAANTLKVGYTESAVSANTAVAANTAKTGVTAIQSEAIVANTAKTGVTAIQSEAIVANTNRKVITTAQANAITANTNRKVITTAQANAITANTNRKVITTAQANAITANTDRKVITTDQSEAVAANTTKVSSTVYNIGDFAMGGIVFWLDETGHHGLVCAKKDQNLGSKVRWYAGYSGSTQAKGDGPYAGKANTTMIIATQVYIGDDDGTYAARICNELVITEGEITYGDWYLPSKAELHEMYSNKATIDFTAQKNSGSSFSTQGSYWSSTEHSSSDAYFQSFVKDYSSNYYKYGIYRVRAVRAF